MVTDKLLTSYVSMSSMDTAKILVPMEIELLIVTVPARLVNDGLLSEIK